MSIFNPVCPLEINAELAAAVDPGLQVDGVELVAILDDDVVAGGLPLAVPDTALIDYRPSKPALGYPLHGETTA